VVKEWGLNNDALAALGTAILVNVATEHTLAQVGVERDIDARAIGDRKARFTFWAGQVCFCEVTHVGLSFSGSEWNHSGGVLGNVVAIASHWLHFGVYFKYGLRFLGNF
jgi:hypothetical protein